MNERKQTKINFYTNILALVANVLVGIYYTPYLVNSLGLEAYGVLPLALIINEYISVATQTLTHAYTRFYSVALQKEDYEEASKDISTSFVVVLLICLLIFPVALGIINNVDSLFQVPKGLLEGTRLLFGYTILSLMVSVISSLLNVTLYATNRLDLMNLLKIIRTVFKLLLIIVAFETIKVDVSFVGLANFLSECLILMASVFMFYRFKPSAVKVSFAMFDKRVLFSILGMSVWVLIQLCGDTLLYRTDNLIVNRYWGTVSSGALGNRELRKCYRECYRFFIRTSDTDIFCQRRAQQSKVSFFGTIHHSRMPFCDFGGYNIRLCKFNTQRLAW